MMVEPFTESHVEEAAQLVLVAYRAEHEAVPALPAPASCVDAVTEQIAGLTGTGLAGFAAVAGGRLLGFLAGYPAPELFSSRPGVYIPVCGHGATGPDRRLVYHHLYQVASAAWVRPGRLMHSLSVFAHDTEALDAWYWLGFGLRCVDAVRPLAPVEGVPAGPLEVRKARPDDALALYGLHCAHRGYYRNAPLFMPQVEIESSLADFRHWLAEADHHLWAAWSKDGHLVSYLRIEQGGGNSFAFKNPQTYNICGAYTTEAARRSGAGTLLLSAVVEWLRGQHAERLGVDYESFNVIGSRFWAKHFTPFLLSPARYIDDRILCSPCR